LTDQPSRSSFQTIRVSPSRSISSVVVKPGRSARVRSPCPQRPLASGLDQDFALEFKVLILRRYTHSRSAWLVSHSVDVCPHCLHNLFVSVT
jgi:hypothetical protein